MIRRSAIFWTLVFATGADAQSLSFPSNATLTRETVTGLDSYAMPIGPWADGVSPVRVVEGQVTQQAWRILATGLTTLQLIRPLRDQLRNDGYDIVFECRDQDCGGFDFRFGTRVLPPPYMQVNLGDFRYLAATKDDTEVLSVIASKSTRAGYVQVIRAGPAQTDVTIADAAPLRSVSTAVPPGDLAADLQTTGRAILTGLTFETGSSQLSPRPFDSLQALADYLANAPDLQVALVGHTDSSGPLDVNIALSKRRAGSVLERLVSDYGVARKQLEAQGMGYLAPVASNLTQQGRDANRRVEVIITSIQ